MGQNWDKFCLLFWKNWILQIRHPIQTTVEILAPVLFSSLLVLIRSLVDVEDYTDGISYPPYKASLNDSLRNNFLAWSPSNPAIKDIMDEVTQNLGLLSNYAYNNSALLESAMRTITTDDFLAGVQFDDSFFGNVNLTNNLEITIRFPGEQRTVGFQGLGTNTWLTNLLFPLYSYPGPRNMNATEGGKPYYQREGFLVLQQEVSLSIINYFKTNHDNGTFERPDLWMRRYPYPRWTDDLLLTALESFVGLIVMLSFVYTCINIVRCVTTEKEKQLKETMKIMGLPGWLHWTAWFVKEFLFLLISVIFIIILVKVKWYSGKDLSVFTATDPTVLLVLFIPYISAIITFSFLISVFFSKANVAATIAGLAWFLSYAPYMFLKEQYIYLTFAQKLGPCIFANTAVAYGFQLMIMFEGNDEGFQWHNIWEAASPDDSLVLGHILLMLVFDAILYLLLAIYIEAVFPGKYGVPQKWYYPFTSSYWCGKSQYVVDTSFDTKEEVNDFIEKEPENLKAGIKIKHLNKVYRNNKIAVRDLTLNLYEDQITALLGHNGAGKTTTMSMLTGIYTPSGGTAVINGYDIRTDMENVRSSLGLCPQSNVLFDELTVRDHLYFFSKLKGMRKEEIENEIEKYLELLELKDKKNSKSSTLSGGMKRKLCVGIALCGNSKIVMLDEPSAGIDPSARRALWDLLQQQKKGRTILLTTHFMDEADLLGDRIAIMADGKLQCCGSSFFLKKKYGAGYHLVIDKMPNCDDTMITQLLQKYLPDIIIESNVGSELTYLLNEEKSHVFENMLKDLEENNETLGIRSYGISLTTLEEVFMKVGADQGLDELGNESNGKTNYKRHDDINSYSSSNCDPKLQVNLGDHEYLTGFALWRNQFLVMFLKRMLSTYRSWGLMLIQIILPVVFLIIAIIVGRLYDRTSDLPSLEMSLDKYENPVTLMNGTDENIYYKSYLQFIKEEGHQIIDYNSQDIAEKIVEQTATNTPIFRRYYIASASFDTNNSVTAWFSNIPYHGAPLSLHLVLNSILKQEMGSNYSIRLNNHPLPFTINTRLRQLANGSTMGFQIAFNLGFSMAFITAFYIMFYIKERVIKAKHLQFVSGVNALLFWAASFLNDIITFVVTVIFTLITLVCFQENGFKTFEDMVRIFSVFLYFCWAVIPVTYLASFCFTSPSSGFTRLTLINIFTGVAAFLVIEVLNTEGLNLEDIANTLHWVFLVIPHYAFATGISKMNEKYTTYTLCNTFVTSCLEFINSESQCWNLVCTLQDQCCSVNIDYYEWEDPGIGRNLVLSLIIGTVAIMFIFVIEYRVFKSLKYFIKKLLSICSPRSYVSSNQTYDTGEDEDVAQEKQKIRSAPLYELQSNCIAMKDVTKYYGKLLAVNKICLTVDRYECFGLLGVNGAGKTTTFKMMTGDIMMSSGDAWVKGISLKENMSEIYKNIGYCPQFDALLDNLTGRETMRMFCMLRGISYKDSNDVAVNLARDFDFFRHLDKRVVEYSGGNKRKLSTAVALIGDPLILYLDEPSTGMDPATKRHLWNVLSHVREKGKCLVLTSHSMEECEALCTRLAVMVNGTFKCIGSVQHLKSKFSEGFTLQVKMRKTSLDSAQFNKEVKDVKVFIETNFPGATLREEHQELLSYSIRNKSLKWSTMFGIMERGKQVLNIEDYSLGQSNLEQVFLSFTKGQRET